MKIVQRKYTRAYVALSGLAASLLAGNNIAFADETDAATAGVAPIETTIPAFPVQPSADLMPTADSAQEETAAYTDASKESIVVTATVLDAGIYGTDQISGTTQPNAYVVGLCRREQSWRANRR